MSETTSAPAPADAPAEGTRPPAALTDNPISVSDAARLLNRQRRPEAQQAQAQAPTQGQAAPAPTPTGPDAAAQMAEALGLTAETQPHAELPAAEHLPGIDVDGRRLSVEDVRRALAHQRDYTSKTQQLAEQQRALQAQQDALASVVPYLQPELERLQQQIQGAPMPQRELAETNPGEYLRQLAAWQHAQGEQQRLAQLQSLNQQAMANAMQRQVEQSNQILAQKFPQWGDPETRSKWQTTVVEWALANDYTRDELRGLTDHRHLVTMMKAALWDRMLAGAKTSAPVPRIQSAQVRGVPPPQVAGGVAANAQAAFDARPNVRNGAAWLTARRLNGGNR